MASYINRYTKSGIVRDLKRKMVFIAGPRQAGKTTFAKELLKETGSSVKKRYMNWDATVDRENIIRERFPETEATQISLEESVDYTDKDGICSQSASHFLSSLV